MTHTHKPSANVHLENKINRKIFLYYKNYSHIPGDNCITISNHKNHNAKGKSTIAFVDIFHM